MSLKKVAIGIDLGTSKCCVGVVRDGRVEILENERGNRTTPSYVAFTDTERLIGEDAKDQATVNIPNTVFGVKRILGKYVEDSQVEMSANDSQTDKSAACDPCIHVTYKGKKECLLPQQVTAMLLTKMKELAETRFACPIKEAVISVPASFNNAQRQATKDAASIAGLEVLALINEPTAAAIAYQTNKKEQAEENIAVVDFGGGKLDVAIVTVNEACVAVRGLSGTSELGGNDVDEILMTYVLQKFKEKYPSASYKDSVKERLRALCVKLKHSLSLLPKVQDTLDCFGDDFSLPISITKGDFSDMVTKKIISDLNMHLDRLSKHDISRVLLVGGSTRIPLVADAIEHFFKERKLDRSINPDEAVAQGAAIYAALLSGDNTVPELAVFDVLQNSFSLLWKGGKELVTIIKGHEIPQANKFPIDELARYQTFEIYEELSGKKNPHRLIGTLCLADELNKVVHLVNDVVFYFNLCGIFDASTQLGPSKDPSYVIHDLVKNYSGRLSSESLEEAKKRELQFREDEKEEKERVEAQTNLESCCYRLQSEMQNTKGREYFLDLVEEIETEANNAIDWLDTQGYVSKADCQSKLKSVKKLERNLREELRRLEELEKERADAENELQSCRSYVVAFLNETDISEEQEKADKVKEQLEFISNWLQSDTLPSTIDCNNSRVTLKGLFEALEQALEERKQEKYKLEMAQRQKEKDEAQKREEKEHAKAKQLEQQRTEALQTCQEKWTRAMSSSSFDLLQKAEPALVQQASQSVTDIFDWLQSPETFCPKLYKQRLAELETVYATLQKKEQELEKNGTGSSMSESDSTSRCLLI